MNVNRYKMKNPGVLLVLLCVNWSLCIGGLIDEGQLSDVDAVRRDLVKVEYELMLKLDIPATRADPEARRKSASMIIEDYAKFGAKLDAMYPNTREQYLDVLKSVWAWARAETKLRDIDGLYAAFRRLQKISIDSHMPVDEKTWQDFSETILSDPKVSVVTALFEVFGLVVDEKLFLAAAKVDTRIWK